MLPAATGGSCQPREPARSEGRLGEGRVTFPLIPLPLAVQCTELTHVTPQRAACLPSPLVGEGAGERGRVLAIRSCCPSRLSQGERGSIQWLLIVQKLQPAQPH